MTRKNRHSRKSLSDLKIDDLVDRIVGETYRSSKQIRRLMTRSDWEDLISQAKPEILQWIKEHQPRSASPEPAPQKQQIGVSDFFLEQEEFVADVYTGLWRLERKLLDPDSGQPNEQTRRIHRHLQSIFDALHFAGYYIIDHVGKPFDPDLGLRILAKEEKAGVRQPMISETIKPTIILQNKNYQIRIQRGDVVLALPAQAK
jgi:hypothetical protein